MTPNTPSASTSNHPIFTEPSYSLTLREEAWREVLDTVFSKPGSEGAAYLLCGVSRTPEEVRFLGRRVVPVEDTHYKVREADALSIASESYVRVAKQAVAAGEAVIFIHSHPDGYAAFSSQDDREDPKLHGFLADFAGHAVHGSLVISGPSLSQHDNGSSTEAPARVGIEGRVWTAAGWRPVTRLRVIGERFTFHDRALTIESTLPTFFDRQVRAFGQDIQRLLGRLNVGVVGAGGTGSAVIEQLTRLGLGRLTVFDGDFFDPSNVNRVYGSSVHPKTKSQDRSSRATFSSSI